MKKLWLNAFTASLILGAVSFSAGVHAGEHHRDRDDWHGHGYDHRGYGHERHCDDDWHGGYRHVAWRDYRPAHYYRSDYRPVYYSPEPVYRERDRYSDDDIHGSITVGF